MIRLSGYTEDEKTNIAVKYLLPKQLKNNGVKEEELLVTEPAVRDIVENADLILDENRRGAGRVQHQEFVPPLEGALLHEVGFEAKLRQDKPDEARMRTEGMMVQGRHAAFSRL